MDPGSKQALVDLLYILNWIDSHACMSNELKLYSYLT